MANKRRQFSIKWLLIVMAVVCSCLAGYGWLKVQSRPKNVFRSIAGFELPNSAKILWDSRQQPQEGAWTTDFIDVLIFRIDEGDIESFCEKSLPNGGDWQTGKIPIAFSQTVDQGVWLPDCPEYPRGDAVYTFYAKNYDERDAGVTNGLLIAIDRETGILKFGRWAY